MKIAFGYTIFVVSVHLKNDVKREKRELKVSTRLFVCLRCLIDGGKLCL